MLFFNSENYLFVLIDEKHYEKNYKRRNSSKTTKYIW